MGQRMQARAGVDDDSRKKSRLTDLDDTVVVPRRLFFTALQWIAIAQGPKIYQKKAL
jgi:hypothetical protein